MGRKRDSCLKLKQSQNLLNWNGNVIKLEYVLFPDDVNVSVIISILIIVV